LKRRKIHPNRKNSDSSEKQKDEVSQEKKSNLLEERKSKMPKKKISNVSKKDKVSVKNEVYEKEKSEVSEERKENSSEKFSQTQFAFDKEASEATNLIRFSPFDVNLFTEEEAKEMKIPSNSEEYTGNNEEESISKDKLFVISKMRKSIQDLTKGYMVNLRIVDYLDIVQKYSKAAQKIISETIQNCTCKETAISTDTP
jgi:hypothetical protein